jgi:acyl-CoA thioester hydrolase
MLPAPFVSYRGEVRPEWADLNNHLNMAYYLVMFDLAIDSLFEGVGIGEAYRHSAGQNAFAAETHVVYEREMYVGQKAQIVTTILDADEKRLHVAQEMFRDGDPARTCLQEIMFISVSLTTRRTAPWTPAAFAEIKSALALHNTLPRPSKIGRTIGITRS